MTTHNQNSRSGAESVEAEYEAKHDGSIEHVESASAVTSGGAGGVEGAYEFTPEQEKRVVRKMDRHIVPLLWTLCESPQHDTLALQNKTDLQICCLCWIGAMSVTPKWRGWPRTSSCPRTSISGY